MHAARGSGFLNSGGISKYMGVALDYQTVYRCRQRTIVSVKAQLLAAVLLVAALAFKVWIKIEKTDLGYQLAKVQQRTVELDMQRRELELERSVLLRPDNLARAAAQELGLKPLKPSQARRIETKG